MMTTRSCGVSDTGLIRRENQDRWFASDELGLFIVADGIAGAPHGGTAAEIVVQVLPVLLRPVLEPVSRWTVSASEDSAPGDSDTTSAGCESAGTDKPVDMGDPPDVGTWLRDGLHRSLIAMSDQLRENSQDTPGLSGMGATAVVLLLSRGIAVCGHLGDSRLYRQRGTDLQLLTADHSLTQLLIDSGDLAASEAASHPSRGQLTRFVGMPAPVLPTVQSFSLKPGDRFLLCSDGVGGAMSHDALAEILQSAVDRCDAVNRLIAAANAAGGKDNATALVAELAGRDELAGAACDAASTGTPATSNSSAAPGAIE